MKRIFITLAIFSIIKSGIGIATKVVTKPLGLAAKSTGLVIKGTAKTANIAVKEPAVRSAALGAIAAL